MMAALLPEPAIGRPVKVQGEGSFRLIGVRGLPLPAPADQT
jgi:hypothetical protein